jgi:hypothetical protein
VTNPFEYGGVVSGDAFCNRQQELADLRRAMQNAEKCDIPDGHAEKRRLTTLH